MFTCTQCGKQSDTPYPLTAIVWDGSPGFVVGFPVAFCGQACHDAYVSGGRCKAIDEPTVIRPDAPKSQ